MKPIITSFLDYDHNSLETQIELANKLDFSHVIIRKVAGEKINQLSEEAFENLSHETKTRKVIAVDPLLDSIPIRDQSRLESYNQALDLAAYRAKELKAQYLIYTLPKFDDVIQDKDSILEVVRQQIAIIKKRKIDVLIKPFDQHKSQTYRYILDELKDPKVRLIFDPVYLYKIKEAMVTSLRILKDYISLLIINDVDSKYAPRLIGRGGFINLKDLIKRFIKQPFNGYVVLDSGLVELIPRASKYQWYERLFDANKRHEHKIMNDFIHLNKNQDTYTIIKVQIAVLMLMFLNKKVTLE